MEGITNIYYLSTTDSVKDIAMNINIASGHNNVFLDVEEIDEKLNNQYYKSLTDNHRNAINELRDIVKRAKDGGAKYIHLY